MLNFVPFSLDRASVRGSFDMRATIILTLFLALAVHAQKRIAIMGTEDDGEPSVEILDQRHLTDKLREIAGDILPKARYGIMTQQSIVDRLGSFEQAVKLCKEATCLVDLGRKVNADFVAQARLGRFSGNLTIKIELYNTGSGNLIASFTDYAKDVMGLLAVLEAKAPALFKKMPGVSGDEPAPVATAPVVVEENEDAYYNEDEDKNEYEESSKNQEERDYSRNKASKNASKIFGNTDEYLFWGGVVFAAAAVSLGVAGFSQHSKYVEADENLSKANSGKDDAENDIKERCGIQRGSKEENDCSLTLKNFSRWTEGEKLWIVNEEYIKPYEKAKDDYNKGRTILFAAAAASVAISVTLFVW